MHVQQEADLSKLGSYETVNVLDARNRGRNDQYGYYTHDMSEDASEACSRVLIRAVPVVYGGIVGGIIENLPLGIALGILAAAVLDTRMGHRSLFRTCFGRIWQGLPGPR